MLSGQFFRFLFALKLYLLWLLHLNTKTIKFFDFFVTENLTRCRLGVAVVAKLNNCRLPSYDTIVLVLDHRRLWAQQPWRAKGKAFRIIDDHC